jgi:DNA sulfur modification protein DndB
MGDTEFFATVLTFGEVARMVDFVEDIDDWDSHTDPEAKSQRKLNMGRVERELVPYLLETDDRFYSALTVEVRPSLEEEGVSAIPFEPMGNAMPGGVAYGTAVLDGTQVLYALDGQHRLKSIQRAIRLNPALSREQVSVILVPFRSHRRSQLLFSDLNRFAKAPSKSISLLFSHRDPVVTLAKRLIVSSPFLCDRVEMETTSLGKNTANVVTLSTLYEMTRALAGQAEPLVDGTLEAEFVRQLHLWDVLVRAVPQWRMVSDRVEHPAYLRQKFLCMHGVCQQAIAQATAMVLSRCEDAEAKLQGFGAFDWTVTNHEWQGVAVQGRRVNNTSSTVRNLAWLLAFKLGCSLLPNEATALGVIAQARGDTLPAALVAAIGKEV